jgi:CRISPR/Cas system-associated endonuclease/helicase Cas3
MGDSVNGRDRLNKEKLVQRACGSSTQDRRLVLLVATWVILVSLDIDLDIISVVTLAGS